MVFYRCTAAKKTTSQTEEFIIQTPDYKEEQIKKILMEVHPEYDSIELEKCDRPAYATNVWGA